MTKMFSDFSKRTQPVMVWALHLACAIWCFGLTTQPAAAQLSNLLEFSVDVSASSDEKITEEGTNYTVVVDSEDSTLSDVIVSFPGSTQSITFVVGFFKYIIQSPDGTLWIIDPDPHGGQVHHITENLDTHNPTDVNVSVPAFKSTSVGTATTDANGNLWLSTGTSDGNTSWVEVTAAGQVVTPQVRSPVSEEPQVGPVTCSAATGGTPFQIPTPAGATFPPNARNLTLGPDGNIWFTETPAYDANHNQIFTTNEVIGCINASGIVSQYTVPTQFAGVGSTNTTVGTYITAGGDGNVWFVESAGRVAKITPTGQITEYSLGQNSIFGLALGGDGNIWIRSFQGKLWKVTPTGTVTNITTTTVNTGSDVELVLGPDGALYYPEDEKIGRVTTSGDITEVPLPTPTVGGSPNYSFQLVIAPSGFGALLEFSSSDLVTFQVAIPTNLSVNVTGSGPVTSAPSGISCDSTCNASFASGTQVTLTATAASGSVFTGWGGACSGTNQCVVTINSTQNVTATFVTEASFNLTAAVSGNGTVTSAPSGISCASSCNASFASGTQVMLTATPASGSSFSGWSGACSGTGSCNVTMNAAESVTATFVVQNGAVALTVSVSGDGTVASLPSGISCPSLCSVDYAIGTQVTLTANPTAGATFNGWRGACTGTGSCRVTMNSIASVIAEFSASGGSPHAKTWVSAALGSDSNPCTRASPCLTFATAFGNTTAGGEIAVVDPGDYGPLTITRALTIYNDGVGIVGAQTGPGTGGIVISAGSSDAVNLRGLIFDGLNGGSNGITINSAGRVNIRNCVIQEFGPGAGLGGVNISPTSGTVQVKIQDTSIINNNVGVFIKPATGATVDIAIDHSRIDNNSGGGVRADGTGGGMILAGVTDSSMSLNAANGAIAITGASGSATLTLLRDVIHANGQFGVTSNQSAGGTATVSVGNSVLSHNVSGAVDAVGGALLSYQNNQLAGNGPNGGFSGTAGLR